MASWLCVVIARKLCGKGEEATRHEIERVMGTSVNDFRMRDDGLGDDCYVFVKCKDANIDGLRRDPNVVTVLESYDNPSWLSDDEVNGFFASEAPKTPVTTDGDAVVVTGDGVYAGLHGVVVSGAEQESEVMFRFHTVTKYETISNDKLIVGENILSRLK